MQVAFDGIQYCCEALGEGKVQIEQVKQTVEEGVGNAKAIYKEVTGLWSWLKSLFGSSPDEPVQKTTEVIEFTEKPNKPTKSLEKVVEHIPDEDEIVQKFVDHVSAWFENHQKVATWLETAMAEAYEKDVIDPSEILRLTAIQTKIDGAYVQLSGIMEKAPYQLGPLWTNFKAMREKVKDAQAKRRNKERIRKIQEAARAQEKADERMYRNLTVFYTVLIITYFWWFIWALWQNSSHSTTH